MEHKLKSILSGAGFYILLALCLAVAGVCGYFLLFSGDEAPAEEVPPPAAVSAPVGDVYVPEPEPDEEEPPVEASARGHVPAAWQIQRTMSPHFFPVTASRSLAVTGRFA